LVRTKRPCSGNTIGDDLLFLRFVGQDISKAVPDYSKLWRFRQKLQTLYLMDQLLNAA
jgi:IS5 family transposase